MKKALFLALPSLLVTSALVGCGESEPTIQLYDEHSRLIINSFDDKGSVSLPTYRHSKLGEVPYNELSQFFYALGGMSNVRSTVKKVEGKGYVVTGDESGKPFLTVDPVKDLITVENFELWNRIAKNNNGIGPDPGSPESDEVAAVHPTTKTKIIGEKKPEVYDMNSYDIDFIEKDGKCFAPTAFLSNLYFRMLPVDLCYNGFDFYMSNAITGAMPVLSRSFYASEGTYSAAEGVNAKRVTPQAGESYRFAYPFKGEGGEIYRIMSLTSDHKGNLLEGKTPEDKGEIAKLDGISYSYEWSEKNDALYVDITASRKDPDTGETETGPQGTQKIPLKAGLYNTKNRSRAVADFNYDLLRFQFDHFYGLKDVAGFTSFDEYAKQKGLKDDLLSLNADAYDLALAKLLCGNIDDGHTGYSTPSIYSGKMPSDGQKMLRENLGPRNKSLLQKGSEYMGARKKALNLPDGTPASEAWGLFMENETALIRFDSFDNPGGIVSNVLDPGEIEKTTPKEAFSRSNVPLGFDTSFYRIKQNANIKNVVIDLTCNGGGMVMAVPYILAHFSDDPYLRLNDVAAGYAKEFHYTVDLNHDNVYGGEGDTYKGKYNFYILTSDFSFSCASFLPAMAKELGVKIIGKKSGGGACTVGSFSDACGSNYRLSSPQSIVTKSGTGYAHIDSGVSVDYEVPEASWYNLTSLEAAIKSHQ